jgi:hypothetical protein
MVIMSRARERKMKRPCADGTVTPASLMAQHKGKKVDWLGGWVAAQRRIDAGQWSLKLTGLGGGGAGTE